jgi:hypothetical protein
MAFRGTKARLLILMSSLAFVPFLFATDITKGEFKGAKSSGSPAAEKSEKAARQGSEKRKTYPFHAKIGKVDADKQLLILEGKTHRSLHLQPDTRITREGAAISLSQAKVGERVTGSIYRDQSGAEVAVSLKVGGEAPPKPAKKPKSSKTTPSKP